MDWLVGPRAGLIPFGDPVELENVAWFDNDVSGLEKPYGEVTKLNIKMYI